MNNIVGPYLLVPGPCLVCDDLTGGALGSVCGSTVAVTVELILEYKPSTIVESCLAFSAGVALPIHEVPIG